MPIRSSEMKRHAPAASRIFLMIRTGNRGHHENDLAFKLLPVKENTDLWRRGRDSNPRFDGRKTSAYHPAPQRWFYRRFRQARCAWVRRVTGWFGSKTV